MNKENKTRKYFIYILALVVISLALTYETLTFVRTSPDTPRVPQTIFIKPSSTLKSIALQLKEKNIVEDPWKFKLLGRLERVQKHLKPGEYQFMAPSSPMEALKILVEGKVILHRVTFPEGVTMNDVAHILEENELIGASEFIKLLSRPDLLQRFQVPGATFEGFLFPDTYYFSKTDEPEKMLKVMTDRFKQATPKEDRIKAEKLGFNLVQWVTFASIVEKESSQPAEQPIISSVFHNRLKKKMRLQSDPTVIYGIPNYDGNIRKKDLLTPTPYNTYTQPGLPPGPIANPGATALKAAIEPANTKYLYFVGKQDGTHDFSETYEEHARKVEIYQLHRKPTSTALNGPDHLSK